MLNTLVHTVGWALLHFVWQGVVVGIATGLMLGLLRGSSPQVRYAVACCGLAAMLAMPVLTGIAVHTSSPALQPAASAAMSGANTLAAVLGAAAGNESVQAGAGSRLQLQHGLPWIVLAWLMGVVILSLRTLGGWQVVRRLRASGVPAAAEWRRRLQELAAGAGIAVPVGLLVSPAAAVPMVLGWLRPVILLPPSVLTGLTPQQLEAILLHELAHVRRHDYLVNVCQVVVEILLFYNPAVWWLSARIREEREHCCDDAAVRNSGGARQYAEALLQLEEWRRAPVLASAATGGSLLRRVRRLLLPQLPPHRRAGANSAAGVLLICCLASAAALHAGIPAAAADGSAGGTDASSPASPAVYIIVEAGDRGVESSAALAAVLQPLGVSAVYTSSDRRTLGAAEPLADLLGVARIPFDFGSQPDRFAQHVIGGSLMSNFGRVAVLVLPADLVASVVRLVSGGRVDDGRLARDEVFVVDIPGNVTRVRITD